MAKLFWGIGTCIIFLQAVVQSKTSHLLTSFPDSTINKVSVCFSSPQKGLEVQRVSLLENVVQFEKVRNITNSNFHCEICETKFIVDNNAKEIKDLFRKGTDSYAAGFQNYVRNVMASVESNAKFVSLKNLKVRAQDYFTDALESIQETLYGAYCKPRSVPAAIFNQEKVNIPVKNFNLENISTKKKGVPIDYLTIDERDMLVDSGQISKQDADAILHTKIVDYDQLRENYNIKPLSGNIEQEKAERAFLNNTNIELLGRCFELKQNAKEEIIKLNVLLNRDTLSVSTALVDKKYLRGKDASVIVLPEQKVIIPEQKLVIPEQRVVIPEQKTISVSKSGSDHVDVAKGGHSIQQVTSSTSNIDESSIESIMDKLNSLFATFYNPQNVVRSSAVSNATGSIVVEEAVISSAMRQKQTSLEVAVSSGSSGITEQFQKTGTLQFPCVITVENTQPITCEELLRRALQQQDAQKRVKTPTVVNDEFIDSSMEVSDQLPVETETEHVSKEEDSATTDTITLDVSTEEDEDADAGNVHVETETDSSAENDEQFPHLFSYTDPTSQKS